MSSLLYEIYHDNYDITPKRDRAQQKLDEKLAAEWDKVQTMFGTEFLDRLFTLEAERADLRDFQYYREGFRLGVRLMLEALTEATA